MRNGMMLVFEVPGEIAGKQRVAQSGRRRFKSTKDRRGENVIAAYARQIAPQLPWREAVGLSVVIRVGVPRSWSKSRQRAAVSGLIRPTAKPDWDNTAKLICDACTGIIWHDDAQIVDASVSKFYGAPGATISVWQVIEGKEVLEAGNCEKEGSFDERSL